MRHDIYLSKTRRSNLAKNDLKILGWCQYFGRKKRNNFSSSVDHLGKWWKIPRFLPFKLWILPYFTLTGNPIKRIRFIGKQEPFPNRFLVLRTREKFVKVKVIQRPRVVFGFIRPWLQKVKVFKGPFFWVNIPLFPDVKIEDFPTTARVQKNQIDYKQIGKNTLYDILLIYPCLQKVKMFQRVFLG